MAFIILIFFLQGYAVCNLQRSFCSGDGSAISAATFASESGKQHGGQVQSHQVNSGGEGGGGLAMNLFERSISLSRSIVKWCTH